MNRREFLGFVGKSVLALPFLGVASSCANLERKISEDSVWDYQLSYRKSLDDERGYLKYLGDREYLVPNKVFDTFFDVADDDAPIMGYKPAAMFVNQEVLKLGKEKEIYRERLESLDLCNDEVDIYHKIFLTPGNIVLKSSFLNHDGFKEALSHERYHREMEMNLNDRDYDTMMIAAIGLRSRTITLDEARKHGYPEKWIDNLEKLGRDKIELLRDKDREYILWSTYGRRAHQNWREFFPYLAADKFVDSVEKVLESDYPNAHKLHEGIRERARLE